jgi:hypothetical protein
MAKKTLQIEFGIINGDNVEQVRNLIIDSLLSFASDDRSLRTHIIHTGAHIIRTMFTRFATLDFCNPTPTASKGEHGLLSCVL